MKKKQIGDYFVEKGLITKQQLKDAIKVPFQCILFIYFLIPFVSNFNFFFFFFLNFFVLEFQNYFIGDAL